MFSVEWCSVLDTNSDRLCAARPRPRPSMLHISNGQRSKPKHQGTSAKAGFWMTASSKCSGAQGHHRKAPQKHGPENLACLYRIVVRFSSSKVVQRHHKAPSPHTGAAGQRGSMLQVDYIEDY